MTTAAPNPGSPEAVTSGCLCPVMDNHYGRGFPWGGRTQFVISERCRMHGNTTGSKAKGGPR